ERPGHGDRSLEGVVGGPVAELVADRGEQPVLRVDDLLARVEDQEAARAVGVLALAGAEGGLAEGGGLLVAEDAGDRGLPQERGVLRRAVHL
ncbi:hypothetical protein ABE10_03280, partial [Bacillus toyonensis]|nr:hypothetical protein [Bacillus toyonensis]